MLSFRGVDFVSGSNNVNKPGVFAVICTIVGCLEVKYSLKLFKLCSSERCIAGKIHKTIFFSYVFLTRQIQSQFFASNKPQIQFGKLEKRLRKIPKAQTLILAPHARRSRWDMLTRQVGFMFSWIFRKEPNSKLACKHFSPQVASKWSLKLPL